MVHKQSTYKVPLSILLLAHFVSAIPNEVPLLSFIWLIWILICLYYAYKICFEKRPIKYNFFAIILTIFWVMNAVCFYISPKTVQSAFVEVDTTVLFKSITISLFSYYPFYYLSKNGYINYANIKKFVLLLYIASILYLISGAFLQAQKTFDEKNVVDQAYLFVLLIPLIMIFYKRFQLYVLMTLSGLLILWGSKRGAILCMAFEMFFFFLYLLKKDSFGKRHKGVMLIAIFLMICIGAYFVLGDDFLQERLLNTGSGLDRSGEIRSERYLMLWTIYFNNSSAFELIFGHGFAQTVTLGDGLAHQDWIELLIDNGFFGIFLYILMIAICIKNILHWNEILPHVVKYALACIVTTWCLMATYSMVYASRESFIMFISLGIINGFIAKAKRDCFFRTKKTVGMNRKHIMD